MSRKSKMKSVGEGEQPLPDDIAQYKLLMLNLNGVIACGFKLEQAFYDLRRKHEGDYVYGRSFVIDTALEITETLGVIFFYLNALTRGCDIGLYYILDDLKKQMNDRLDNRVVRKKPVSDAYEGSKTDDPIMALLGIIKDYTVGAGIFEDGSLSAKLETAATIRDLINYCYNRVFDILDSRFQSIMAADRDTSDRKPSMIGIPTSYLLTDEKPVFEKLLPLAETDDIPHLNPGASRLLEGIYEVQGSDIYLPFVERSCNDTDARGILIYSNETLALYHLPGKFKNMVSANICDAVGGNHVNLLIGSGDHAHLPPLSHQLVRKLLDWLDFHTFAGHGFINASISNITRGEMENHLNMLGKLLSFASSTVIPPSDDESVQRNIEVFLENII